jgi:hypothetical protein
MRLYPGYKVRRVDATVLIEALTATASEEWKKDSSYTFYYASDGKRYWVDVRHNKKQVAKFDFIPNGSELMAETSAVLPEHRRKGIATEAYRRIEKLSGMSIINSGFMTDDAIKFWKQKSRPFGDGVTNKDLGYSERAGRITVTWDEDDSYENLKPLPA